VELVLGLQYDDECSGDKHSDDDECSDENKEHGDDNSLAFFTSTISFFCIMLNDINIFK